MQLRIPVSEGERYKVGKFDFADNKVVKTEGLRTLFKLKPGDWYSDKAIRKGLEKAREVYGAAGYFEFTGYPDLSRRGEPALPAGQPGTRRGGPASGDGRPRRGAAKPAAGSRRRPAAGRSRQPGSRAAARRSATQPARATRPPPTTAPRIGRRAASST